MPILISVVAARLRIALRLSHREEAQAMVEYALILSLVTLVILITLIVLGNTVKNTYCNIQGAVVNA